jgi:hypothetical protein
MLSALFPFDHLKQTSWAITTQPVLSNVQYFCLQIDLEGSSGASVQTQKGTELATLDGTEEKCSQRNLC